MLNPDQIVYLNGEFLALEDARISVLDRGFIYGDGVYEVIPVYGRQPFRMPHHLRRLQYSLDGIRLGNPHTEAQWETLVRELIVKQPQKLAARIRNAGAIFLGAYSAPPLGDYMAGPNHVLPTGGSARFFSPLGTYDFLKRTTIIQAEKRALRALAPKIAHLARLEGLDDHARSVEIRFNKSF